jgi:hypothetical protein
LEGDGEDDEPEEEITYELHEGEIVSGSDDQAKEGKKRGEKVNVGETLSIC